MTEKNSDTILQKAILSNFEIAVNQVDALMNNLDAKNPDADSRILEFEQNFQKMAKENDIAVINGGVTIVKKPLLWLLLDSLYEKKLEQIEDLVYFETETEED
jgi:spore coat polysaccharide biosynthesis predicted glycosyltransferase SpsG